MIINLIVIKTKDIEALKDFYELFGIKFKLHKHGKSPYHYFTDINGIILEIYPSEIYDTTLRLGFKINNFSDVINNLSNNNIVFTTPKQTEFGFMSIVTDIDGRKIEIYDIN